MTTDEEILFNHYEKRPLKRMGKPTSCSKNDTLYLMFLARQDEREKLKTCTENCLDKHKEAYEKGAKDEARKMLKQVDDAIRVVILQLRHDPSTSRKLNQENERLGIIAQAINNEVKSIAKKECGVDSK